jgi:2-oxoglutarate dehydrogenase E1 component
MLVPILDEVVAEAGEAGVRRVFVGMAHRGRLNVLAHVFGKPYHQIFAEFSESTGDSSDEEDTEYGGDVKYHVGARHVVTVGGRQVELCMPPNPSHLEAINPVLEGMARAGATSDEGLFDSLAVLPILIHGDAAFPARASSPKPSTCTLAGYSTGGHPHHREQSSASRLSPTMPTARSMQVAWRARSRSRSRT